MDKRPLPEWVTQRKTIRQLIDELLTFENLDIEVRISLDYGETHRCVSMVANHDDHFCVLMNAEDYHNGEWQEFVKREEAGAADGAPDG